MKQDPHQLMERRSNLQEIWSRVERTAHGKLQVFVSVLISDLKIEVIPDRLQNLVKAISAVTKEQSNSVT